MYFNTHWCKISKLNLGYRDTVKIKSSESGFLDGIKIFPNLFLDTEIKILRVNG